MLKHIVMWKFKDGDSGVTALEHAEWMKKHLEALIDVVPDIISLEFGINAIKSNGAFDAVLTICFPNEEAMHNYKIHPEHKIIMEYCKNARIARSSVDYFL